jgi:catecholate siderophore receptor
MSVSKGKVLRPASLRFSGKSAMFGSAVGLSALAMAATPALAQQAEELATVKVEATAIDANPNAEVDVPYKARTSGDERHTRPLAETPQTITVLTKAQIDDSGYTDLSRILDAQPGITLGTGENGNAFGDRYIIRGQEARSDTFVDGLRDPGMTIRESFAVEQLEITKGPNSSFAGRGSSGGAINAITKQANPFLNFANVQAEAGSDKHVRLTLDGNVAYGENFAIRGNVLYASEDVPDRAPANRQRKGIAVSTFWAPTDKFDATLDYYAMLAKDLPDTGGYLDASGAPAQNVPVFAQNTDFLTSDVDTVTARLKYQFSDNVRLTSLTRYGQSDNAYVITGSRAQTTGANNPGGAYLSGGFSAHQGWQDVTYFATQQNLFINTDLLGMKNEFVLTAEYTDNHVINGTYRVTNTGAFNCITGTGSVLNNYCTIGADGGPVPDLNNLLKRNITKLGFDQDWQVKTTSLAVMDTVDLTDKLTVFGGLRYDNFDFDLLLSSNGCTGGPCLYSGELWNGHLGVTYDVTRNLVAYASYSSSQDINGGESDVGGNSGYGGVIILGGEVASAKPERSRNYEVGVKWNTFGEKLLLTAAAFRIDKTDVHEGQGYTTVGTYNSGANRVTGIELGATGNLTDKLTVQAGIAIMDAEITKSFPPTAPALPIVGLTLSNFAEKSGVIQAKYQLTDNFYFGGAVKYEGERYGGQPDTAPAVNASNEYTRVVPAYTVVDAFASYRFNPNLEARLNVSNVGDEDYYLAVYRGGFFLYRGDKRAVRLSLNYDF